MGIDFIVGFPCEIKQHFGEGDCAAGTKQIVDRLKARDRAEVLTQLAIRDGKDPAEVTVTLEVVDESGAVSAKKVSLNVLAAEAQHTRLEVGSLADADGAESLAQLVDAMYTAWLHNVPLVIDG